MKDRDQEHHQPHDPGSDPELEARIVALVLGEALDFERRELENLIAERPELAAFRREMEDAHGWLEEVSGKKPASAGESAHDEAEWKLAPDRRTSLLAALHGPAGAEGESVVPMESEPSGGRRRLPAILGVLGSLAAAACVAVLGIAFVLNFGQEGEAISYASHSPSAARPTLRESTLREESVELHADASAPLERQRAEEARYEETIALLQDPYRQEAAAPGVHYVEEKLKRIIIPEVDFEGVPLRDAVMFLRQKSVELDDLETDPTRRGVSIVIEEDADNIDADPEVLAKAESDLGFDGGSFGDFRSGDGPPISLKLTNVPLIEALRYTTALSRRKFKVEPHGIVIEPFTEASEDLHTKVYDVPPEFFASAAETDQDTAADPFASLGDDPGSGPGLTARHSARSLLESRGISFPPGASVVYNPSTSQLIVRNTEDQIGLVEGYIDSIAAAPPGSAGDNLAMSETAPQSSTWGFSQPADSLQRGTQSLEPQELPALSTASELGPAAGAVASSPDNNGADTSDFSGRMSGQSLALGVIQDESAPASGPVGEAAKGQDMSNHLLSPGEEISAQPGQEPVVQVQTGPARPQVAAAPAEVSAQAGSGEAAPPPAMDAFAYEAPQAAPAASSRAALSSELSSGDPFAAPEDSYGRAMADPFAESAGPAAGAGDAAGSTDNFGQVGHGGPRASPSTDQPMEVARNQSATPGRAPTPSSDPFSATPEYPSQQMSNNEAVEKGKAAEGAPSTDSRVIIIGGNEAVVSDDGAIVGGDQAPLVNSSSIEGMDTTVAAHSNVFAEAIQNSGVIRVSPSGENTGGRVRLNAAGGGSATNGGIIDGSDRNGIEVTSAGAVAIGGNLSVTSPSPTDAEAPAPSSREAAPKREYSPTLRDPATQLVPRLFPSNRQDFEAGSNPDVMEEIHQITPRIVGGGSLSGVPLVLNAPMPQTPGAPASAPAAAPAPSPAQPQSRVAALDVATGTEPEVAESITSEKFYVTEMSPIVPAPEKKGLFRRLFRLDAKESEATPPPTAEPQMLAEVAQVEKQLAEITQAESRQRVRLLSEDEEEVRQNVKQQLAYQEEPAGLKQDVDRLESLLTILPQKPASREKAKAPVPASFSELSAADEAFSTFSLHVSDVSFKLAQAALEQGQWPEAEKIRIEEFVNAFDYGDPMPTTEERVASAMEQAAHPFLQQRNVLRVSMKTAAVGRSGETPLRLTLLLDNSGSMERPDRRQAVLRAFQLLADQLKPDDRITLIGFALEPRLMAEQVSGDQAQQLVQLAAATPSEGGTNLEAALKLARDKARAQFEDNAQNRIILLTDGAANLGNAKPEELAALVEEMRNQKIAFDAAGVGADGLNDEILEALTRKGDGRYYFLNGPEDADEGFARQIAGALRPAAMNVKVQVEFNPDRVGNYKLLGFEKHLLNQEDFRNDAVDAAEMAAEEAGVALYQFEPKPDGRGDVGSVSVRFRDMATGNMVEKRWPIPYQPSAPAWDQSDPSLRLATAAAMLAARLKGDPIAQTVELETLANGLSSLPPHIADSVQVRNLRNMIQQARQLAGE